ncbi:hypothetical protein BH23PLA1_BH23PLA1_34120 [soil metagenome]
MTTTITVVCPQCKHKMRASAQHLGRQGRCPACNALVSIKAADADSLVSLLPEASSRSGAWGRKKAISTDVNPWLTAAIAAIVTIFLYAVFLWMVREPREYWFGQFMCQRGFVQPTITFVTCWGLSLLAFRFLAVRRQLVDSGRELELIPLDIGMQITSGNVDEFLAHLNQLPRDRQDSILLRRIRGALEHFKFRNSVPEVQNYLSTQAEIDASGVDSGYTLLRAFIWVCPILGFVGTVLGISGAIGGLKQSLDEGGPPARAAVATANPGAGAFEQKIKEGMNNVTGGLATAFDTTLLGLVCVILLLFPTELLRKVEYATLDRIEVYANESLLRRMSEGGASMDKDPAAYAREALEGAFQQHQQWLAQWQDQVARLGQNIGGKFEVAMREVLQRLSQDEALRLERMAQLASTLDQVLDQARRTAEAAQRTSDQATSNAQRATESRDKLQDRLGSVASLFDQILDQHQQVAKPHLSSVGIGSAAASSEVVKPPAEPTDGITIDPLLETIDTKDGIESRSHRFGWWKNR